jgi:hypothetical protein
MEQILMPLIDLMMNEDPEYWLLATIMERSDFWNIHAQFKNLKASKVKAIQAM